MPIDVSGIAVDRIVVHQLFPKDDQGKAIEPRQGTKLISFADTEGLAEFENRLRIVLQKRSKSVELEIKNSDPDSTFQRSVALLRDSDADYIGHSYGLAKRLDPIQHKKAVYGGMLAVVNGTCGAGGSRFVALIKAEAKPGFQLRDDVNGTLTLQYLRDVVLGDNTKLYKVALFVESTRHDDEDPRRKTDFEALVYDHLIVKQREDKAARYFFDDFLGCDLHAENLTWGLKFYDDTVNFILSREIPVEQKIEKQRRLVNYVQSADADLNAADLGQILYDQPEETNLIEQYEHYLDKKGLPGRSIIKNVDSLRARTQTQVVKLSNDVTLTIPRTIFMMQGFEISQEGGYTTLRVPGTIEVEDDA